MIKTGVVGYGFSGRVFQCPFIEAHGDFELVGVVERHRSDSKKDYPDITLYRSLEEMLLNDSLDLVVIATPAHMHFEHAMKALEAKKHVLIEKPFAATKEEARLLIEKAKEVSKVVTVYQNRRFDSDFLTIKEILSSDIQLYEFEAIWDRVKLTVDENDWHEQGHIGSDNLFDLGTHFLDQAIHLFGKPNNFYGLTKSLRKGSKIADYFSMELDYEDKVVRLKSCLHATKPGVRYKLHTSKGTYYFYKMDEQENQLLSGLRPLDSEYGDKEGYDFFGLDGKVIRKPVIQGSYMMYFDMLSEAINHGGKYPVSTDDALLVIELLDDVINGKRRGTRID